MSRAKRPVKVACTLSDWLIRNLSKINSRNYVDSVIPIKQDRILEAIQKGDKKVSTRDTKAGCAHTRKVPSTNTQPNVSVHSLADYLCVGKDSLLLSHERSALKPISI